MKKSTLFIFSLLCTGFVFGQKYQKMIEDETFSVYEIQEEAKHYFDSVGQGRGTGNKEYKRWEYKALRSMDEMGYLRTREEIYHEFRRVSTNQSNNRMPDNSNWEEVGPTSWNRTTGWNPGVGRVTSVVVDPNDHNHIIVGSPTGGIWRTTDGAINWAPLLDSFANLEVYSLAMHPTETDTYFWGSTSGLIFKTTNGGETWVQVANLSGNKVNKILIDARNPLKMFASIETWGLYRSIDGGVTWSEPNSSISTSYDVEFKPGDTDVVYSTGRDYYKSIDGGATFSEILGSFNNSAKMMGVSADDPSIVYIVESNGSRFNELYKSTNSGASFVDMGHSSIDPGNETNSINYFGYSSVGNDNSGQAPRDMDIAVNPTNVDEVHIAGINTWRSLNGGTSFNISSQWYSPGNGNPYGYAHADIDILEYVEDKLYVGSDGGIHVANSPDGTINNSFYSNLSDGLGIRQFYKIGVSRSNPEKAIGGAQDNGTSFIDENGNWYDWLGADGMECFIDKDNDNIFYGTSQGGTLYKSTNGGASYFGLSEPESSGNWVTPFEQDPTLNNVIYAGYQRVQKSINGGSSWSPISQDFDLASSVKLDELKIAPSNSNIIYTSYGSALYKTTDGGSTDWTEVTGFSGGTINSIAIHPTDANKVAIATSGSNKVSVTANGGTSWANYNLNLPSFTAYAVAWQDNPDNGLYVGMDYGIYYIDDTQSQWEAFGNNLPNIQITELEYNSANGWLYAGTYGRGLWKSYLVSDCSSSSTFASGNWSMGEPTIQTNVTIATDYDTAIHGEIEACTLTINSGATLKININDFIRVYNNITVNGALVVEHTGNLVQINNSATTVNNGSISVKITTPDLASRDFMVLGSPVSLETRNSVFVDPFLVLDQHTVNFVPNTQVSTQFPLAENFADDNGDFWQIYNGAISPGVGYIVRPQSGYGEPGGIFNYSYELGTVNNGEIDFSVIYNNNKNDSPNVLANPYPSAISADAFIDANSMVDEVFFWEHLTPPSPGLPGSGSMNFSMQDISMYNKMGGNAAAADITGINTKPKGVISTAQGFGVKATAGGIAKFNNSMRLVTGNNTLRLLEERERVWLQLKTAEHDMQSTTLVGFTPNATNGFDKGYDSRRLASVVSLYSHLEGDLEQQMGIQSLQNLDAETKVLLGFSSLIDTETVYEISMLEREGALIEQVTTYLYDNELEVLTDLTAEGYTFASPKGTFDSRFTLLFSSPLLDTEQPTSTSEIWIYPNPVSNELQVISRGNETFKRIDVLDLQGRILTSLTPNSNRTRINLSGYASNVYFVHIYTENGTQVKQIVKE